MKRSIGDRIWDGILSIGLWLGMTVVINSVPPWRRWRKPREQFVMNPVKMRLAKYSSDGRHEIPMIWLDEEPGKDVFDECMKRVARSGRTIVETPPPQVAMRSAPLLVGLKVGEKQPPWSVTKIDTEAGTMTVVRGEDDEDE